MFESRRPDQQNQELSSLGESLRDKRVLRGGKQIDHFYRDVPRLGNVAVSRHAQTRMLKDGIPAGFFA